jgi:hypothetical protein
VVPAREDLVLGGQVGAAGVDQVQAGQPVGGGDLLGPQVLGHGERVVGPALDGGVVGHDDALAPGHPPDAGDDPGPRRLAAVHVLGGQGRQLQEGRARVEQGVHPLAGQQLAALDVAPTGCLRPAQGRPGQARAQLGDQGGVRLDVGLEPLAGWVGGAGESWSGHAGQSSPSAARSAADRVSSDGAAWRWAWAGRSRRSCGGRWPWRRCTRR